jgi:hypothetical protein
MPHLPRSLLACHFLAALGLFIPVAAVAAPSVGGGTLAAPASGPAAPAFSYGNDTARYVLVKNWDFGLDGTVRNNAELSAHFQYHDQFGLIANGGGYGSVIVAPDAANAKPGQPVEEPGRRVREFLASSMRTYLVPLKGATLLDPKLRNTGNGSFQAKWTLPNGGSLLGQDMIWETRVRYVTPPYFWFAIWTAGNKWTKGAEMDLIESFGYDNGGGSTNFDGRYWHSSSVGGKDDTNYHAHWGKAMKSHGILKHDATQWHVWTWVYRADDTFTAYLDGKPVQTGKMHWTFGAKPEGEPINMSFIFDGGWGHQKVKNVSHTLPASELKGKYYDWDYSRIWLRQAKAR